VRYRQFLLDAGTDKVRHSERTLFDHLCGTHNLLRMWGNEDDVCVAGLFHSIYGTNKFKHKAWPLSDRATIQGLIGLQAERLACRFGRADRPRAWFNGYEHLLPPDDVRALREIEAANLLDQRSRSKWLTHLHASNISEKARIAIATFAMAPKSWSWGPHASAPVE